jgi:glycosyltransferase involved in cell wall biosynthesis
MIAFGIEGNYRVIPNVVDTSIFNLTQADTSVVRFLHVSSLIDKHKNISGILRSWKIASDSNSSIHLSLGGDGPIEIWKHEAIKLGIRPESIDFFGELSWQGIAQKMQESHALLMFSNYENLPCVIVEALACGLPVISTRVGGISEHISAENGILIEAGDEIGLTKAIQELANSINRYDKQALRNYAVNHFSNEAIAKAFNEIYTLTLR